MGIFMSPFFFLKKPSFDVCNLCPLDVRSLLTKKTVNGLEENSRKPPENQMGSERGAAPLGVSVTHGRRAGREGEGQAGKGRLRQLHRSGPPRGVGWGRGLAAWPSGVGWRRGLVAWPFCSTLTLHFFSLKWLILCFPRMRFQDPRPRFGSSSCVSETPRLFLGPGLSGLHSSVSACGTLYADVRPQRRLCPTAV